MTAIILASGSGIRFQDQQPKQFMKLAGMPVLAHTIKVFETCPDIDDVIVVCQESYTEHVWEIVLAYGFSKVSKVVCGGATRQESSFLGISCCESAEYVLIHDSVRPFLTHEVIRNLVDAVKIYKAVDTVIPSADTIVEVDTQGFIVNIPDRARFRRGQTPQAFSRELILAAHEKAMVDGLDNATDDCQLVMYLGQRVFCVEGGEQNIKITYPIDLHIADKLFQLNSQQALSATVDLSVFFHDRVAVVLGGTAGIGASLANLLTSFGCRVYVCGRHTLPAVDVTCPESIEAFLRQVTSGEERIDFVVNCAGDLIRKPVDNMDLGEWRYLYDVNVSGCFNLAKALIPIFKKQHGGYLMFVGSSSYTRGRAGFAAYSSSKAALVNFCQALAEELTEWNVQVNVASPGRVNTPLRQRNFGKEDPATLLDPDWVAGQIAHALAMKTTGSVIEIG